MRQLSGRGDAYVCIPFLYRNVSGNGSLNHETVSCTPLPLYDKTVCLALPLLRKDGIQPILYAVDFLALPSTQSQQAVIQRRAVVCMDVEVFRVFLDGFHNLPRAGLCS